MERGLNEYYGYIWPMVICNHNIGSLMWCGVFCWRRTTTSSEQSSSEPQGSRGLQASTGNRHDFVSAAIEIRTTALLKPVETTHFNYQISHSIIELIDLFLKLVGHRFQGQSSGVLNLFHQSSIPDDRNADAVWSHNLGSAMIPLCIPATV